jgi:CDP-glucose 4,6-dehydratase
VHYLVTGHTGFKGTWLALLLNQAGHEVSGLARDPVHGALYERVGGSSLLQTDHRIDIRDAAAVQGAITQLEPDVVIHLAAQPLVRESYRDPRGTFDTNVSGTVNVLEAVGKTDSVQATLIVTTDKVYRNDGRSVGYVESDPLGGHDPYSASKAMADLATQSWRASYPASPVAIARAGNVIGGGDVSPDRLMPDLLAGFASGRPVDIRSPHAIRPWQHVLDCLQGYLLLVDQMLDIGTEDEWNFGPSPDGFLTVADVANAAAERWGEGASWQVDEGEHPPEAGTLTLDATKARQSLGWRDRLSTPEAIAWTVEWEQEVLGGVEPLQVTLDQIKAFQGR